MIMYKISLHSNLFSSIEGYCNVNCRRKNLYLDTKLESIRTFSKGHKDAFNRGLLGGF